MPLYDFLDMENNEVFEAFFKFAEKDDFLQAHPNVKQVILKPPMIVSGVGGVKTDDAFQDLLKKMASENPETPFGKSISHGGKTPKQVKTSQAVEKWKSKAGVVGMMGGQD
jgi:hypothetical protein|tara:strand:- start:404 stop:736 length:333 start_codon:yes stop_codon:yes gene_type:complete